MPLFAANSREGEKVTGGSKAAIAIARRAGDIEGHKTVHPLGCRLAICREPLETSAHHPLVSGQSDAQFSARFPPDQLCKLILMRRQGCGRAARLQLENVRQLVQRSKRGRDHAGGHRDRHLLTQNRRHSNCIARATAGHAGDLAIHHSDIARHKAHDRAREDCGDIERSGDPTRRSRQSHRQGRVAGHGQRIALGGDPILRGDQNCHRIGARRQWDRGCRRVAVDCHGCIGVIGGGGHQERARAIGHRGRIGQRAAGKAWAQAAAAQRQGREGRVS